MLLSVLALTGCSDSGTAPGALTTSGPPPDPAVVQTLSGVVHGYVGPDFRVFRGIPYAAAPVGELRWQPPVPRPRWEGVREATQFGLRCVQDTGRDPDFGRPTGEDCLNLNVWTPRSATPADKRAVLVWIHGGGFLNGSADIYDASWLTTRGDVVVVTVNYRLGALGFLALPQLSPDGQAGNYGLADQQAALRWVHDNIAAFGGDPDKVTVAGESAGAMSVCNHLVAPGSAGLFRSAILQSGPCQAQADRLTAARISADYAATVGCAEPPAAAQCLRRLPPARFQRAPTYVGFGTDRLTGPVYGTGALPLAPMDAFAQGKAARVPALIGTTGDEFTMFVAAQYILEGGLPPYRELLSDTFGPAAAAVAERYPLDRFAGSTGLAYAAAVTDGVFACPTDRIGAALTPGAPVYGYEFNDRTAPAPELLRQAPFPVGASHSLELRYLFDIGGAPPLNPAQSRLSDQMIRYWSEFVKTGAPDVAGQPEWPALGPDAATAPRLSLQTGDPSITTDFGARHQCPFWASVRGAR